MTSEDKRLSKKNRSISFKKFLKKEPSTTGLSAQAAAVAASSSTADASAELAVSPRGTGRNREKRKSVGGLQPLKLSGEEAGEEASSSSGRKLSRTASSTMKKMSLPDFIDVLHSQSDHAKTLRRQQSHSSVADATLGRPMQSGGIDPLELLNECTRRLRQSEKTITQLGQRLQAAEENEEKRDAQMKVLKKEAKQKTKKKGSNKMLRSEADFEKDLRAQLADMHERYEELELRAESRVTQMGILLKESEDRANKARDTATRALNRIAKAEKDARQAVEEAAVLRSSDAVADARLRSGAAAADGGGGGGGGDTSLFLEQIQSQNLQLQSLQSQFEQVQEQLQRERARSSVLALERSTHERSEKIASITLNLLQTARTGGIVLPENMLVLVEQLDDTLKQALEAKNRQKESLQSLVSPASSSLSFSSGSSFMTPSLSASSASASSSASSASSASSSSSASSTSSTTTLPSFSNMTPEIAAVLEGDIEQKVLQILVIEARGIQWARVDPVCRIEFNNAVFSTQPLSQSQTTSGWHESFLFGLGNGGLADATVDFTLFNAKTKPAESLGHGQIRLRDLGECRCVGKWIELRTGSSIKRGGPAVYVRLFQSSVRTLFASALANDNVSPASSPSSPSSSSSSSSSSRKGGDATETVGGGSRIDSFATLLKSMQPDTAFDDEESTPENEITSAKEAANALPTPRLDLVAKFLRAEVAAGTPIDSKWINENDETFMHLCTALKDLELLPHVSSKEALAMMDMNGMTPAHIAARSGFLEGLQYFAADLGLDVNCQMHNRLTPLHFAALSGHFEVCQFLLSAGARVNHQDKNGVTALMMATHGGHTNIVELLLESDADTSIQDKFKNTSLLLAYLRGHFHLAKIMSTPTDNLTEISNALGDTPLWGIAMHYQRLLADSSLDKMLTDFGRSALNQLRGKHELGILHRTLIQLDSNACATLVPILLKHGANPLLPSGDGKTPLHYACRFGRFESIKTLLSAIPQPAIDSPDKSQNTPLHFAALCSGQATELVLSAFAQGQPSDVVRAFVAKRNSEGNTALHCALAFHSFSSVSALVRAGADPTTPNKNQNRPKDCLWSIAKVLLPIYPDDESLLASSGLYISRVNLNQ